MKKYIKEKLYKFPTLHKEKVFENIDNYDVVSFDLFDTLLKRNFKEPQDVFHMVRRIYEQDTSIALTNFVNKRINAEKLARIQKKDVEINIIDIYKLLDYEDKDSLMKVEEFIELEAATLNIDFFEIYQYCINKGKQIFLISDMYLNKSLIEQMLRKVEIYGYKQLYVSSETGKTKASGKIFKLIQEEKSIDYKKWIHIGDSYKGDFESPRKYQINSYLIPRNIERIKWNFRRKSNDLDHSIVDAFINNAIQMDDTYFRFGYEVFGVLLYGFSKWLLRKIKFNEIKKVVFFSRDGYILKKAFDIINYDKIKSEYLYVSRRSILVPRLWMMKDLKSLLDTIPYKQRVKLGSILSWWGLEEEDFASELEIIGVNFDTLLEYDSLVENEILIELYSKLWNKIYENSKKEYRTAIKYLNEKIDIDEVAVVDIGYAGSMQAGICELLSSINRFPQVYGFYIGTNKNIQNNLSKYSNMFAEGYIYDNTKTTEEIDPRGAFVGLFESLFLAQEGSTKNYADDEDGTIHPFLFDYEYVEADQDNMEIIESVQKGALKFVEDFNRFNISKYVVVDEKLAFEKIERFGNEPDSTAIHMFADMLFMDEGKYPLAQPNLLHSYLLNPLSVINDLYNSRWKTAFFKRLFKIPFPYYQLYKILRKL